MHVLDALTASCDGRITVQDAAQAYYESICASADSNSARAGARAKKNLAILGPKAGNLKDSKMA